MAESQYHNASMNAFLVPASKKIEPNEAPKIENDPLVSFEFFHFQIQSDLRNWMTFSKEDRMKKAALFGSEDLSDGEGAMGRTMFKWSAARRHKVLNYIIWIESISQKGSREVASIAFNALLPKPKAKE